MDIYNIIRTKLILAAEKIADENKTVIVNYTYIDNLLRPLLNEKFSLLKQCKALITLSEWKLDEYILQTIVDLLLLNEKIFINIKI